jgi:hypothetical protein
MTGTGVRTARPRAPRRRLAPPGRGAVLAFLVLALMLPAGRPGPAVPDDEGLDQPGLAWRSSYSERFPGCVSAVLWPVEEQPVAIVARRPGGEIVRVAANAVAAAQSPSSTIGACR